MPVVVEQGMDSSKDGVGVTTYLTLVWCSAVLMQPSAACVRSVMANVPSATHMCGQQRWCGFVMSATMAPMRAAA
jgi:hypothetical protein